ncbi:hypothetical protein HPB52_009961 [Rhipicephalus sanguineus]|uniref:Uncharacterized protein n=1 Tax=Rhipicephalus sanguineus TaxID=34632 RepID=A0A9D4PDG2_RHISA|nr:hypothetical protein HPB52_009961 [Rhipicephalus sanguineus]
MIQNDPQSVSGIRSLSEIMICVQAPEEAKVFIPVLDDEFHDGRNLGAEDTRSSLSSEGNAEGGGVDIDTGREQSFPPSISSSATLPETTTTFAQVPAPLVPGLPFAKAPEEPMTHTSDTTVLADPPEPLLLLREHSLAECAPGHLMLSDKVLRDKRKNVALSIIREPIDILSSIPKKPAVEPPAKSPGMPSRILVRQASLAVPRLPLSPRNSRSPPRKGAFLFEVPLGNYCEC